MNQNRSNDGLGMFEGIDDRDDIELMEHTDTGFVSRPDPHGGGGRSRTASVFNTFMNLLKSYLGSGILGLPSGFKESGFVGGIVIMLLVGSVAGSSNMMLVACKQALQKRGVVSYSDIAVYTYGKKMGLAIDFLLLFTQFGFCCVYLVFVSLNLTEFIPLSREHVLFAIAPLFVLFSFIPSLEYIGPVSLLANAALLFGLGIILIAAFVQLSERPIPEISLDVDDFVIWKSLPVMFGISVYAYEGIGVILPCETAMREPRKFPPVVMSVMSIAMNIYIVFGSVCYLAFGRSVTDQMTSKLAVFASVQGGIWPVLEVVVRISLIFTIAATFPVQLFVVIDIMEEEIMFKNGRLSSKRTIISYLFRTLLVLAAVFIAWLVPNFGPLIGLIGAFGSSALQFIAPALFYFKIFPEMSIATRAFCCFLILFGTVGGILGTIDSILELIALSGKE